MLVSKWGNSLAVRLPKDVVEKLGLKIGDRLNAADITDRALTLSKDDEKQRRREEALKRLTALRLPLPPGYKFSRDEIYDRPRSFTAEERAEMMARDK
jgi:antitoxin MazE